jgi:hypothetical protein
MELSSSVAKNLMIVLVHYNTSVSKTKHCVNETFTKTIKKLI